MLLDHKLLFAIKRKLNANFNLKVTLRFSVMIKCKGSCLPFQRPSETCKASWQTGTVVSAPQG